MPHSVETEDKTSESSRDIRIESKDIRAVSKHPSVSMFQEIKALGNRRRALKKLFRSNPKTVENTIVNIETFLRDSRKVRLHRSPRHHWAMEVSCLTLFEVYLKLKKKSVTFEHVRENLENMYALVDFLDVESPSAAQYLARQLKRMMILLADLSSKLEHYAGLKATKWTMVAETLTPIIERQEHDTSLADSIPSIKDFSVSRILGAGGFGAVYKARYGSETDLRRGVFCTVKLVPRAMFEVAKHACVDKVVGSCSRHPFIARYFSTFLSSQAFVTVQEYIRGVDLSRAVKRQKGLKEEQVRLIMAQVGLALNHMHLKGFIHRDIKPSNMMVMPGCVVKLIDFDTIKIGIGCFTQKKLNTYNARTYCEFNDRESAGTLPYFPPEVIKVQYYGRALDWWAVGVTTYQCFFGKLPFRNEKDDEDLKRKIIECKYQLELNDIRPSSVLRDFITQLMTKKVSMRLCSKSFSEYLNHDFFAGISWSQIERGQVTLPCQGIDSLCQVQNSGVCSPIPPDKDFGDEYLKLSEQKESKDQIELFTYLSPGFRNVMQKHHRRQPMNEGDLEDPPEAQPKQTTRRYRFGNYLYRPKTRKSKRGTARNA
ncbi:microtubule-associated serine/threonine-protein kinase 2-like [Galendromus occidentalis]|uniref:Microtubule-associated serine/threonine-protein kinase 2-like n=1 Tax=Galendromus occidentalis TaxID=34638 RepID=A0AAJ6QWR7_9ACAR|nr:microtubule-associated serine/threonine-protein kinase 2-like [Galendromus occidentalis]